MRHSAEVSAPFQLSDAGLWFVSTPVKEGKRNMARNVKNLQAKPNHMFVRGHQSASAVGDNLLFHEFFAEKVYAATFQAVGGHLLCQCKLQS